MKAVVAAFNQEKALVWAFSVIVKTDCETDGSSAALILAQSAEVWHSQGSSLHSCSIQKQAPGLSLRGINEI